MPRKPGSAYRSSLTDNVRPGAPTTMDVMLRWITTPGNVKRWRNEKHPPLVREIVDIMQEEGLAHRKAPFVRYKLDAIEKQYITAKQWLLETGMHDAFMRGKATKEVKAHVDHVCPLFRRLDPAFRGVSFSKKNAETIELDDSTEDVETDEKEQQEEDDDDEESDAEELYKMDEEDDDQTPATQLDEAEEPQQKKKNTFRERLLSSSAKDTEEKAPVPAEAQQKTTTTFRERMLSKVVQRVAEEEKRPTPIETQTAKSPKPAEPQKKKRTPSVSSLTSAVQVAMEHAAPRVAENTPALPKKRRGRPPRSVSPATNNAKEAAKTATSAKETEAAKSTIDAVATEQAAPKTAESTPAPVKKRRGRPPKAAVESPAAINVKDAKIAKTTNGAKGATKTATGAKRAAKAATGAKGATKAANGAKEATTVNGAKEAKIAKVAAKATSDKKVAAPKSAATKRKNTEEETSDPKRPRTQERVETDRDEVKEIEREAALKRVRDEEKQRHVTFELERAKLECELEAKQVQLLYEKASARKKLDQLGVPQEEIDRILPL